MQQSGAEHSLPLLLSWSLLFSGQTDEKGGFLNIR